MSSPRAAVRIFLRARPLGGLALEVGLFEAGDRVADLRLVVAGVGHVPAPGLAVAAAVGLAAAVGWLPPWVGSRRGLAAVECAVGAPPVAVGPQWGLAAPDRAKTCHECAVGAQLVAVSYETGCAATESAQKCHRMCHRGTFRPGNCRRSPQMAGFPTGGARAAHTAPRAGGGVVDTALGWGCGRERDGAGNRALPGTGHRRERGTATVGAWTNPAPNSCARSGRPAWAEHASSLTLA